MMIDNELIEYLEDLSNLSLPEDEKERIKGDLQGILGYMQKLGEINTKDVIERSHPFNNVNCFREDEVSASLDRGQILKNAPERNEDAIIAPLSVE